MSQPERLRLMFNITAPAIREAVRSLGITKGSHGLDAGCGCGCHLGLLAQAVGLSGRVTALDISAENLDEARAAHGPTIEFVQGDIRELPFADDSFDWVWCADTLWAGESIGDPATAVGEFKRVLRPGGKVALLYWSGQTLLPGHPFLEARLNAAFAESAPYLGGVSPEAHYLRAGNWLRDGGLNSNEVSTFVAEVKPPVDPVMRRALAACFAMFWGELEGRVSAADWEAYKRLCDPDSPDFIGDAPDYHAFVTYTLFWGVK